MSLELGVYSFSNTPRTPDGGYGHTAQAIRNVLEAVKLAEDVGLDFRSRSPGPSCAPPPPEPPVHRAPPLGPARGPPPDRPRPSPQGAPPHVHRHHRRLRP